MFRKVFYELVTLFYFLKWLIRRTVVNKSAMLKNGKGYKTEVTYLR